MALHEQLNNLSSQRNFSLDGRSLSSFNDLPDCLVVDILSRLPVKACVLSTSVSKKWYSTIKNPSFISFHLSRSISDPSMFSIFLVRPGSQLVTVISDYNHVLIRHPNFNIPFETRSGTYKVIGTCNGLVCLTDYDRWFYGGDIYLMNPFIYKYKKIGAESSCYSDLIEQIDGYTTGIIQVSFWYCEVENDYKILRILFGYDDARTVVLKRFEIYSLNTSEWKVMVGMDALDNCIRAPVFVNGCLYWPPGPDYESLLCFNLKDKLFYKINLPAFQSMVSLVFGGVLAHNGSIAIWVIDSDYEEVMETIHVFYLDKGIEGHFQWKKLLFHEFKSMITRDCIGFSVTGSFVLAESLYLTTRRNIVAVDPDKEHWEMVEKLQLDDFDHFGFSAALNVLESLALFSD